jgi:hypothetical protein
MRNVVINGRSGATFGRRTVNGESQVFILWDDMAGTVDDSGEWFPVSVLND